MDIISHFLFISSTFHSTFTLFVNSEYLKQIIVLCAIINQCRRIMGLPCHFLYYTHSFGHSAVCFFLFLLLTEEFHVCLSILILIIEEQKFVFFSTMTHAKHISKRNVYMLTFVKIQQYLFFSGHFSFPSMRPFARVTLFSLL